MKKIITLGLALAMTFSMSALASEEVSKESAAFEAALVSEPWYDVSSVDEKSVSGGRMYFNEDGTGHFKNWNIVIEFQWKVEDGSMIMEHEENGETVEDKFPLCINQDRYEMTDESGQMLYWKESDAKTKLENAAVGSEIELGTYEQDNKEEDGKEVLRWIVVDDETIPGYTILASYYGLDVQPYNTEDVDVTWETCSLRKWLNEDFYNTAFSEEEKAIISPISLQNPDNRKYGTPGGNTTIDTVWLFGEYDARNYMDFMQEYNGQVVTTDYVQGLGEKEVASFWLRTSGSSPNKAAVAWDDSNFGEVESNVTETSVVRPVILVSNDAEVFINYRSFSIEERTVGSIAKVGPGIGMTADEVKSSSWGSPEKVNVTETSYGVREQWVYSNNRYIYLEDGIVTSIQYSE